MYRLMTACRLLLVVAFPGLGSHCSLLSCRADNGALTEKGESGRRQLPVVQPRSRHPGIVTLRAVGDIMLAGPMGELMAKRGRGYPFAAIKPTLRQAYITFGNLECSVASSGAPIEKKFRFRADPAGFVF